MAHGRPLKMFRSFAPSLRTLGPLLLSSACAELAPDPPRSDVEGCYRITLPGSAEARAPEPPMGLELTEERFLAVDAPEWQIDRHRFDARRARAARFVYPDTTFSVAWWWVEADDRRFGIGNRNQAAAFYIEGVVRGERLEGEMRRWLFDGEGRPVQGPDSWRAPVTGLRAACERR